MTCHANTKKQDKLDHEVLLDLLEYSSDTGVFRWKINRGAALKGSIAGCIKHDGYRYIAVNGEAYVAHRLAWFYMNKAWPKQQIDHINHNKTDNRIKNLRDVSPKENCNNKTEEGKQACLRALSMGKCNGGGLGCGNGLSPFPGCSFYYDKCGSAFRAEIKKNGKWFFLASRKSMFDLYCYVYSWLNNGHKPQSEVSPISRA